MCKRTKEQMWKNEENDENVKGRGKGKEVIKTKEIREMRKKTELKKTKKSAK